MKVIDDDEDDDDDEQKEETNAKKVIENGGYNKNESTRQPLPPRRWPKPKKLGGFLIATEG